MDKRLIRNLEREIPELNGNVGVNEITKGYSMERKFIVYYSDHNKSILRTTKMENFERKKTEYNLLRKLRNYKVNCPKPRAVGLSENLKIAYMLISYIEGNDAIEVLPKCSIEEQYRAGFEAGKDLRKIHRLRASSAVEPWFIRKSKKYYHFLGEYKICGNIIMNNKRYAGIIDFNRYDWGDPIHEFYKLAWFSTEISISFSIGQICGYYNNRVPKNFWRLYSLYVAMSIFPTIVWFLSDQPNRIDFMKNRINAILEDHKYFELLKPKWYNV